MIPASLLSPDLPAVSPIFTPTVLLFTSLTVGALGAAILLLSREQPPRPPHTRQDQPPDGLNDIHDQPAGQDGQPATTGKHSAPAASAPDEPRDSRPIGGASFLLASGPAPAVLLPSPEPLSTQLSSHAPAVAVIEPEPPVAIASARDFDSVIASRPAPAPRPAALGASALIAQAERLLPSAPAPAPSQPIEAAAPAQPRTAGFQPAARFSRSQQAFLRVPIVVCGSSASGAEFREETNTVILLPQGAVIHMQHHVRAGERLTVLSQPRQHEASCTVFGALPGPDGKMLVEIDFDHQQRTFWPVSFPAWAGKAPAAQPARTPAPARPTVSGSSGS